MEQTTSLNNHWGISIDKFCDFIPFVSLATNTANLYKIFQSNYFVNPEQPTIKDHYYEYLSQKGATRCFLVAIPGLNIFFAFYYWFFSQTPKPPLAPHSPINHSGSDIPSTPKVDDKPLPPSLKDLVSLCAKEVAVDNLLHQEVLTRSNEKSYFLELIDTCDSLPPSYKENFLRKLAKQHESSSELEAAFKERNIDIQLLKPNVWQSIQPFLNDCIFPNLSITQTCQTTYNTQSLEAIELYKGQFLCTIQALQMLKEFELVCIDLDKTSPKFEHLNKRYCQFLSLILINFNKIQVSEVFKNLAEDFKKQFFAQLVATDFKIFTLSDKLRELIVNFIFQYCSNEQMSDFFDKNIAIKDDKWGCFFLAFCKYIYGKEEKICNIFIELGKSEKMLEPILKVFGEMEYLYTKHEYSHYINFNIRNFLIKLIDSFYHANPQSTLWEKISKSRKDSYAFEALYRSLARIKICVLLTIESEKNGDLLENTSRLKPYLEDLSYGRCGAMSEYTHLSHIISYILNSKAPQAQKETQLNILFNAYAHSSEHLRYLIEKVYSSEIQNKECLLNRFIDIQLDKGNFVDLKNLNSNILKAMIKRYSQQPEPMRSALLEMMASLRPKRELSSASSDSEDSQEPIDLYKAWFEANQLDIDKYEGIPYISTHKYLFLKTCSEISSQETLETVLQKISSALKLYQQHGFSPLSQKHELSCLQILCNGLTLPDSLFKIALEQEQIKDAFERCELLSLYEENSKPIELHTYL